LSKFDGLFDSRSGGKGKKAGRGSAKARPADKDTPPPRPTRGRPSGKRSDPDYVGFTTYIRKETHRGVKRALLDEPEERELSELVEELLANWLKSRPKR
jgi:hypothetical protein